MRITNFTSGIFLISLLVGGCAINISNSQSTQGGTTAKQESRKSSASGTSKTNGKMKVSGSAKGKANHKIKLSKKASASISSATKYKKGRIKLKAGGTLKGKSTAKGKIKISLKGKIASNASDKNKGKDKTKNEKPNGIKHKADKKEKTPVQTVPDPPEEKPEVITPEEVEYQAPPEEPSENDFGYEKPVYGCFEGEVMFIEPNSKKLPTDYSKYDVMSVLYACEWDIPARSFDTGFPGVENQFEWFAIRYSGAFGLDKAGSYTFRINSDDGAKLYIDGKLVVDNDGVHAPESKSGTIELAAGDHEMVLEYFQGPRYYIALQLFVTPPGGEEGIFSVR